MTFYNRWFWVFVGSMVKKGLELISISPHSISAMQIIDFKTLIVQIFGYGLISLFYTGVRNGDIKNKTQAATEGIVAITFVMSIVSGASNIGNDLQILPSAKAANKVYSIYNTGNMVKDCEAKIRYQEEINFFDYIASSIASTDVNVNKYIVVTIDSIYNDLQSVKNDYCFLLNQYPNAVIYAYEAEVLGTYRYVIDVFGKEMNWKEAAMEAKKIGAIIRKL